MRLMPGGRIALILVGLLAGYGAFGDDAVFTITHGPMLQSPAPGEVTIAWHTSAVGVSKVLYGENGALDQTAVRSVAGLIPNDATYHWVRLTGLKPGTTYQYKVVTRTFKGFMTPYLANFGPEVESEVFSFTTLDPNKAAFSFLMWNDIHEDAGRFEALIKESSQTGVDFTVFNGDMMSDFTRPNQPFKGFYDVAVNQFARQIPVVYVRGNHETRGALARRFDEYFPGKDGRYYWSFDQGPAHIIVLDSCEDKEDSHKEYAGLTDFGKYREEQAAWLKEDLASDAAKKAVFRIVLSHQPSAYGGLNEFGVAELRRLYDPIINAGNVQLWLSGHTHSFMLRAPHEQGDNGYYAVVNPHDGTTRVDVSRDALKVTVTQLGGNVLKTLDIPAK